jgi:tetratricopeptide (TPR) repeat protein
VPLPDDIDPRDLDFEVRKQLKSLSKDTAELVARHLVVAGRLMDEDPEQALKHARAARALAGRVGAVREANGLVAYAAGEWSEALSELRTARRLSGDPENLAVIADCERALGRPDRALLVTEDPQAKTISPEARVELLIVASGARRDLGQAEAAAASLQVPALEGPVRAWTARLRYAYADALLDAGREDDARVWFARAAEVDEAGETDADDRVLELDGMVFEDLDEDADDEEPQAWDPESYVVPNAQAPTDVDAPEAVAGPESAAAESLAPAPVDPEPPVTAEAVADPEPVVAPPAEHGLGQVFRELPDSEIPALGKAGSTGLGFVAPPAVPDDDDDTDPPGPAAPDNADDLRLFD